MFACGSFLQGLDFGMSSLTGATLNRFIELRLSLAVVQAVDDGPHSRNRRFLSRSLALYPSVDHNARSPADFRRQGDWDNCPQGIALAVAVLLRSPAQFLCFEHLLNPGSRHNFKTSLFFDPVHNG